MQTVFLLFGIHGLQVAVVLTRSEDACRVRIRIGTKLPDGP